MRSRNLLATRYDVRDFHADLSAMLAESRRTVRMHLGRGLAPNGVRTVGVDGASAAVVVLAAW
jgi:hypothetical protein